MVSQPLVLATHNAKKLGELDRILRANDLDVVVRSLADFPGAPEPDETERTFAGNAVLKAASAAEFCQGWALADDSGLAVEELNEMPGVRSARWAGPQCDDQANLDLLLAQLSDVPSERRGARFVCALALARPGEDPIVWHGEMAGKLAFAPVGENGFGYDPIFIPEGYAQTSAQLSSEAKDAISHRGNALRQFVAWLKEQ